MWMTSLGFCLRVIVNEKPLDLEKTTSSVLSVLLLIYGMDVISDINYVMNACFQRFIHYHLRKRRC